MTNPQAPLSAEPLTEAELAKWEEELADMATVSPFPWKAIREKNAIGHKVYLLADANGGWVASCDEDSFFEAVMRAIPDFAPHSPQ